MKIPPSIPLILCAAALASCEKVKTAVGKAKESVVQKIEAVREGNSGSATVPDRGLQALVDHTDEGYLFRKDLPFPAELNVNIQSKVKLKGRFFHSSFIGKETLLLDGTVKTRQEIERRGGMVVARLYAPDFEKAAGAGEEAKAVSTDAKTPAGPKLAATLTFLRENDRWTRKPDRSMSSAMAGNTIVDHLPEILSRDGLSPRAFWFGKTRLKIGDEIKLGGEHLKVIVSQPAKGTLTLKLTAIEALDGHPCGVFSLSGNYDSDESVDFSGEIEEEKMSIQSGKVWLSLLYPVVLKEDYEAIVTFTSRGDASNSSRSQGSASTLIERNWKPVSKAGD